MSLYKSPAMARQFNGSDLQLELQRHAQQKKTTTSSATSTLSSADTLKVDQSRADKLAREDVENQRKSRFYHAAATAFSLK
jgi:hypothetical protein